MNVFSNPAHTVTLLVSVLAVPRFPAETRPLLSEILRCFCQSVQVNTTLNETQ
jgi:hypothetical protein